MSIRQSLLAILDQGACYGYQLRAEFERRTGSAWPLNIGQIYSTLDRLVRDGLAVRDERGETDQVYYAITAAGRAEVASWLAAPVARSHATARDELAMKLAVAATLPGVDVVALIRAQREAIARALRGSSGSGSSGSETSEAEMVTPDDLVRQLVADSRALRAEAEIRWLDQAEALLVSAEAAGLTATMPIDDTPVRRGRPVKTGSEASEGPPRP